MYNTVPCNTHKPNRVTIVNSAISRTIFLLFDLKVYFLLAKKLKINAIDVDIVFAVIFGKPKFVNPNKRPKSSAVLIMPISPKRILVACF